MWPFRKSEPASSNLNRKKDGRTKTGFSYGPSTINKNAREMLGDVEGMKDMPEVLPKKKKTGK